MDLVTRDRVFTKLVRFLQKMKVPHEVPKSGLSRRALSMLDGRIVTGHDNANQLVGQKRCVEELEESDERHQPAATRVRCVRVCLYCMTPLII